MYSDSRGIACFCVHCKHSANRKLMLVFYHNMNGQNFVKWGSKPTQQMREFHGVLCWALWFTARKALHLLSFFFRNWKKYIYLKGGKHVKTREIICLLTFFYMCLSCPFSVLTAVSLLEDIFALFWVVDKVLSSVVCASFCDSPLSAKQSTHSDSSPHKIAS